MTDLNTSWKNSNIFYKQLHLNLQELSCPSNYPQHWRDFLLIMQDVAGDSIVDIGCGCGAYSQLIEKYFRFVSYTGIDYAEEAISLAKKTWPSHNFFVKDLWTLDENFISSYDIVHTSALFDVMSNGDDALNFLLSLNPKLFIISRIDFTDSNSYYDTYQAYDELTTCKYYHNKNTFLRTCNKHNYSIKQYNTNILLTKF